MAAQKREAVAKTLLAKQGDTAEEASRRGSKPGAPGAYAGGKIVYRWARLALWHHAKALCLQQPMCHWTR